MIANHQTIEDAARLAVFLMQPENRVEYQALNVVLEIEQTLRGMTQPAAPREACACGGEVWAYAEDGTPKCEEHAA